MRTDTASPTPTAPTRPTRSLPLDSRTLLLIGGDALAFLLFAAIGRKQHGEAAGLSVLGQIIWTALPFALGWFIVAPFLGAFRRQRTARPRDILARTELAWVAAWPAALFLRWVLSDDHQIPVSFAIVILIANAIILGAWRTAFAAVAVRRAR